MKRFEGIETVDQAIQADLAIKAKGDKLAKDQLIRANMKLVATIANKYHKNDDDLLGEGYIGLCEAVDTFDPARGCMFSTHAAWSIKGRVLAYLIRSHSIVRIGTTQAQRKLFFRLRREQAKLAKEGGSTKDTVEIAKRLEVSVEEVEEMNHRLSTPVKSLDSTLDLDEGQSAPMVERTASPDPTPEACIEEKLDTGWVQARMVEFEQTLNQTEMTVWNKRIASEDCTGDDVGKLLGVTRQRIAQIEKSIRERFVLFARAA